MPHFTNSNVTSGPTPAIHAGLNYVNTTYTLSQTASGSTTIAMCNLPAGARIVDAQLTSSGSLDTTGGGNVAVVTWTNGNSNGEVIASASGDFTLAQYTPVHAAHGYRHTASSIAVIQLTNMVGVTGTSAVALNLSIVYDCQLEGD